MLRNLLNLIAGRPPVQDGTPGGAASALLLESGFGLLLEDGNYILLES